MNTPHGLGRWLAAEAYYEELLGCHCALIGDNMGACVRESTFISAFGTVAATAVARRPSPLADVV